MATKQQLENHVDSLQKQVRALKSDKMSKTALSATIAAVKFLTENIHDVKAIDLNTSYGELKFKFH